MVTTDLTGDGCKTQPEAPVSFEAQLLERLSPKHLAHLREERRLTDAMILASGAKTLKPDQTRTCLRRDADALGEVIGFPCLASDGSYAIQHESRSGEPVLHAGKPLVYVICRPDKERRSGPKRKYEVPSHSRPAVYFAPRFAEILRADPNAPIFITEGPIKALRLAQAGKAAIAINGVYCFGAKPKNGDAKGLLPELKGRKWGTRPVVIAFDSDRADKVDIQDAERQLAELLVADRAIVRGLRIPHHREGDKHEKQGIDDYLNRHGDESLAALLTAAVPLPADDACPAPGGGEQGNPGTPAPAGPNPPANQSQPGAAADLPTIDVDSQYRIIEHRAHLALIRANNPPVLFVSGGALAELVRPDPNKASAIRKHDADSLRIRMSHAANFEKTDSRGNVRDVDPPPSLLRSFLKRANWDYRIPHLDAVTTCPILRRDGSVCQTPGYDAATRLYYEPVGEFDPIPENPTHADALAARDVLLHAVRQFDFAGNVDRGAWLSIPLTLAARHLIDGPVPAHVLTASTRGAGKTSLVNAGVIIATGCDVDMGDYPYSGSDTRAEEDGPELRKVGVSCAVAGTPAYLFDNVPSGHQFGGGALDKIITARNSSGRLLTTNDVSSRPAWTLYLLTGNNITPRGDSGRRCVTGELRPTTDRPERRDFDGPEICTLVRTQRPKLLCAVLTILSAYLRAGCPKQNLPHVGTFENWSDLVRSAIAWIGLGDCRGRAEEAEQDDPDTQTAGAAIALLVACGAEKTPVTAAAVVNDVKTELKRQRANRPRSEGTPEPTGPIEPADLDDLFEAAPGDSLAAIYRRVVPRRGAPDARVLVELFKRYKGRIVGGKRIVRDGDDSHTKAALWRVTPAPGSADGRQSPPSDGGSGGGGGSGGSAAPPPEGRVGGGERGGEILATPSPASIQPPSIQPAFAGVAGVCGGSAFHNPRSENAGISSGSDDLRGLRGLFSTSGACAKHIDPQNPDVMCAHDGAQKGDLTPATPATAPNSLPNSELSVRGSAEHQPPQTPATPATSSSGTTEPGEGGEDSERLREISSSSPSPSPTPASGPGPEEPPIVWHPNPYFLVDHPFGKPAVSDSDDGWPYV